MYQFKPLKGTTNTTVTFIGEYPPLPRGGNSKDYENEFLRNKHIQSTPDNSNLQGKSEKGSSYLEFEENSRE